MSFFASSSRRQRYLYYQISHFLSRTFFIYFFQVLNLNLKFSGLFVAFILPTTLIYYTLFLKNVNTFFQVFSFLFFEVLNLSFSLLFFSGNEYLLYSLFFLCQHLFYIFFKKFQNTDKTFKNSLYYLLQPSLLYLNY